MNNVTSYVDLENTVIERIECSLSIKKEPDPDGLLARKFADDFLILKGNYNGLDGYLERRFKEIGRIEAVYKFVRLKR